MTDLQPSQVLRFDALDPAKQHEVTFSLSAACRALYPFDEMVAAGHWFCVRKNGVPYNNIIRAAQRAEERLGARFSTRTNDFEGKIYVVRVD